MFFVTLGPTLLVRKKPVAKTLVSANSVWEASILLGCLKQNGGLGSSNTITIGASRKG